MPPCIGFGNRLRVEVSDLMFSIDISHSVIGFRENLVQPIRVNPVCPVYVSKFVGSALLYDLDHGLVVFGHNKFNLRA